MTQQITNPAVALLAWFAAGFVSGAVAVLAVAGEDERHRIHGARWRTWLRVRALSRWARRKP